MTYEQARAALLQLKGLDGGRRQWHSTPANSYANGDQAPARNRPGFFETQYGVMPSEKEISDFWMANGGGGKKKRKGKGGGGSSVPVTIGESGAAGYGAASSSGPASAYEAMLLEAAGDQKKQGERAFKANEKRYLEDHGLAAGVLQSGMAEVDNWGNVQYQRNAEAAQQNLDKINTDLTDYGLANSTNRIAAKLNSDKNLALEQQDLSERKSDRMIQTNRTLTGDLRDVIRSRVDNAPDPNQLMAIYAKLGEAQAMDQARATAAAASGKPRKRSLTERMAAMGGGGPRGVSGGGAARLAAQMQGNFMGGLNGAMGALMPQGGGLGTTSNQYPRSRFAPMPQQVPVDVQQALDPFGNAVARPTGAAAKAMADLMRKTRGLPESFKGQVDGNFDDFGPYYWQQNPMMRK